MTNGSYTDTLLAPTTAGEAWQQSSYNTGGQEIEAIVENTNGSWIDNKYWIVAGQAASELEESDLHNVDGSQTDTIYNDAKTGTWKSYVLTVNAAGVNQDQKILNNDGSTADWEYDSDGRAYQATQTATDGSYKITYFNNNITSVTQWDWQQWSYNTAGVLYDQIIHNDNSTWTENKYYFYGATATVAAYSSLLETDTHNLDGTESEKVLGMTTDNYNYYTVQVNALGQNVIQTIVYKDGSIKTTDFNNGQVTSQQVLQPNGTFSNANFNGAGGVQVTNYTALGVATSTITYNGASSVQQLSDGAGVYEQDSFSGTNNVVRTLNNTSTHPEDYQSKTEYWTGNTLTETVELDTDGVSVDTKYASDGSYTITVKDTNNTQAWSEQVQTYNSSKVETQTYDAFHDGSQLDTQYNSSGQATLILTTNADGSFTQESITPTGNATGIDTATYAYNASKVEVEAAFTYFNGEVMNIDYSPSGNGNQVSENIWDSAGDTWTYQYYADGTLESERIDLASGAVTVDSYYDNGSKSTPGSAESVITTNANGSGQAFGYDKTGGLTSRASQNSDGSKVVKAWDTSGSEPWTNYVIDYNSNGSISDAQFTLKDSVQDPTTGNWVSTTTLYDSAHPTDHTVLLMTEAGLEEENAAQPANNKQDVQQRVTLPDGENYLVTVKADGSVYTKNEHGTFFDEIESIEPIISIVADFVAVVTQQYWIIPIVTAVDGVTQLAEGNIIPGVIDIVAAAASEATPGSLVATVGKAVITGLTIGEGVESLVAGIKTGNVLTALSGAVQAAAAGLIGFGQLGQTSALQVEVFQALWSTAEGAASGNVLASITAASEAIGEATGVGQPTADQVLTDDASVTSGVQTATGDGNALPTSEGALPTGGSAPSTNGSAPSTGSDQGIYAETYSTSGSTTFTSAGLGSAMYPNGRGVADNFLPDGGVEVTANRPNSDATTLNNLEYLALLGTDFYIPELQLVDPELENIFQQVEEAQSNALEAQSAEPSGGSPKFPENDGFLGTPVSQTLERGTEFSRYGGGFNESGAFQDLGNYAAPTDVPYGMRSLPPGSENRPLTTYEVVSPIEGVLTGPAAPWFGEPGLGIQYLLPLPIQDYIISGQIRIITQVLH